MVVSLLRNPGGSEKREEKNQRESAINRMFSFRTIDRECETGIETRDEGKLKFRDTEGTLIGKGTEDPLARERLARVTETIRTKFHYVTLSKKLPI